MEAYCGDDAQGRFLDYIGFGAIISIILVLGKGRKKRNTWFAKGFFVRTSFSQRDLALEEATALSLLASWGIGTLPTS
jgi:hypothetical protein